MIPISRLLMYMHFLLERVYIPCTQIEYAKWPSVQILQGPNRNMYFSLLKLNASATMILHNISMYDTIVNDQLTIFLCSLAYKDSMYD